MKRSSQGVGGTSFHNHTFKASKAWVVEVLGQPDWVDETPEDKVQNEWCCETEDGNVFTIYDWKEYRTYGDDEIIEWHIGGHSGRVTRQAQEEIEALLNKSVL
jgi:hypothetical protein